MPALSRLYIRTALVYLALGGLLGGLLLWDKGLPFAPGLWAWLPVHVALVSWGWLWHLTLGVAYWILPRFARRGHAAHAGAGDRGHAWLAVGAYACLNASLLAAALIPWLHGPWPGAMSGLLQLLSALAFVVYAWPRVKAAGR